MATKMIAIRLAPELETGAKAAAKLAGVDLSTWIRQRIEDSLIPDDLAAIRDVVRYATRRGVTGPALVAAAKLLK